MIGLPELLATAIAVALNGYVLTGGADFGGGVWDLFAYGPRRDRQRALIADSIAPIWEANHVWLIVVVVVLFTAFPQSFAMLGMVMHIPLTVMLIGIVLRGSAFVFRTYGPERTFARWGAIFAMASIVTPLTLGVVIGAIANGAVADGSRRVGSATFADAFVRPWLSAFPIEVGVFALALFSFLAAAYLTVEAVDDALSNDFRVRALIAEAVVLISGTLIGRVAWLPFEMAAAVAALIAVAALWQRHYRLARLAAAAQVSVVLWGWLAAQYPYVIPPALTLHEAAAPAVTLRLLAWGLAAGALVLLPSLRYMFRVFKGRRT